MKKITGWMRSLPETVTVSGREGLLMLLVCLLAGFAAGMLCSPHRSVMIASHNGNTGQRPEEDPMENEQE